MNEEEKLEAEATAPSNRPMDLRTLLIAASLLGGVVALVVFNMN
jgi:hypothetical protein